MLLEKSLTIKHRRTLDERGVVLKIESKTLRSNTVYPDATYTHIMARNVIIEIKTIQINNLKRISVHGILFQNIHV
jgi:hypothetical protein